MGRRVRVGPSSDLDGSRRLDQCLFVSCSLSIEKPEKEDRSP